VKVALILLLLAATYAVPTPGSCKDGVELIWPLSRSGDNLILKLPPRYAGRGLDQIGTKEGGVADMSVEDDLMITALWPELNPPADYDSALFPRGSAMQALIQPRAVASFRGQPINKLESDFDITIDMARRGTCSSEVLARSGPVTQYLCQKTHKFDSKPDKFGLQRVGIDFKKYSDYSEKNRGGIPQRDMYYLRDREGHLQTSIACTAEEADTHEDGPPYDSVAYCEHKFIDARLNALVAVHYRRAYLPEWRDVEAGWRRLLESFVEARDANVQH
jgi:hypothetical protein